MTPDEKWPELPNHTNADAAPLRSLPVVHPSAPVRLCKCGHVGVYGNDAAVWCVFHSPAEFGVPVTERFRHGEIIYQDATAKLLSALNKVWGDEVVAHDPRAHEARQCEACGNVDNARVAWERARNLRAELRALCS